MGNSRPATIPHSLFPILFPGVDDGDCAAVWIRGLDPGFGVVTVAFEGLFFDVGVVLVGQGLVSRNKWAQL